jgi:hypothetical protein
LIRLRVLLVGRSDSRSTKCWATEGLRPRRPDSIFHK